VCGYGNPLPIKTPDASLLEKATTTRVYSINILNVLPGATSTYFQASKGKTKSKKWARVSKKNYISSIVFAVGLRASTVKQTFMINILKEKGKKNTTSGQMKRECTYCLTDDRVFDSIDATGKHSEGQSRVEAEVEKHVPSFPTDADRAAKETSRRHQNKGIGKKRKKMFPFPICFIVAFHLKETVPRNTARVVLCLLTQKNRMIAWSLTAFLLNK
jgi:hypothetical protein